MKVNFADFKTNTELNDAIFYTILGSETSVDKDGYPLINKECDSVYAKKIKNKKDKNINGNTSYSFYIRTYSKNKLYNPLEKHTVEKPSISYVDRVCKNNESFIEVNKSIFETYLEFLKTKRLTWLDNAQRAIT